MKNLVEQRKEQKRNHILALIRHSLKPLSRFDIKKLTQYSMTTVLNTITDLIEEGLILEDACCENNRMGRKPIFLQLNPDGGYFIGVEFNILHMHYVVLDFAGNLIYEGSESTKNNISTAQFLLQLQENIEKCFLHLSEKKKNVLAIGLGLPGYIDMDGGIALHYTYIKDWIDIPIVSIMENLFHVPCYIGNNISTMSLAFKWLNQYRQSEDFVFVSIRTGVRSILFINGEPYLGKNCSSGELGHVKLNGCKKLCTCGQTGCLNTEVSVLSIQNKIIEGIENGHYQYLYHLAEKDTANVTIDLLIRAALDDDAEAIALIRETAAYLGYSLSSIVNVISPPNLIIASPLCKTGDIFLSPLTDAISKMSVHENYKNLKVYPSPFGENIGAIGAAVLMLEQTYNIAFKEL